VFLCGTGISAPQLPTFEQLVDKISAALDVPFDPSEQAAYRDKRYEEVLGSIERRLARRTAMVEEAARQLAVPALPVLDQHRTVLRLSRDIESRVLVVTTNFDTLLERAIFSVDPTADITGGSFAGQALPAPGSANFVGIIHLHGRLQDDDVALDQTPLVLTSADYGDAYMRSGWASRFLFDLARCKTIVLIGYSAGDAPVRYFLNVLAADRYRFPDLKPVYAFDFYDDIPAEAENRWGTVAVTPIAYCRINPVTSSQDHAPLWADLARLADLVEHPRPRREDRLTALLAEPPTAITDTTLAELRWLIGGRTDLWAVVIETLTDADWFKVFQDNELWSVHDARWVLAAWVAKAPQDAARFLVAVEWLNRLGTEFVAPLMQRLSHAGALDPVWRKAWRQFGYARPTDAEGYDQRAHTVKQKLESGLVLEEDLQRAIGLLAPGLHLRKRIFGRFGDAEGEDEGAPPQRLADLAWIDFGGRERYGANEILVALDALAPLAPRILDIATTRLQSTVWQAVDLDMILDDTDFFEGWVPSIEAHEQNEHHDGPVFLVRAIVMAFEKVAVTDRDYARRMLQVWLGIPGRLGTRLGLHALRSAIVFDADEAMRFLRDLREDDFWQIRREIAMLLGDRAGTAAAELLATVETRIIETGEAFFTRYPVQDDQPDWRPYARDNEVWLRLNCLAKAGALSSAGAVELAAIRARRPHLARPVEDRDFFTSYMSGVQMVSGDTASIAQAAPDDRLRMVQTQERSPDIEQRHGWSSYCRTDPRGALDTLATADLAPVNLGLWATFLSALSSGEENSKAARDDIAVEALVRLTPLTAEQLTPVADQLVDLFMVGPRGRFAGREDWYDRLWDALALNLDVIDRPDLADASLNRPAGRLTQILVEELEAAVEEGAERVARQRARLASVADSTAPVAIFARATMVRQLAFLLTVDPALVAQHLKPRLAEGPEASQLRQQLIRYTQITSNLTQLMASEILLAVVEEQTDPRLGESIAAGILRPGLAGLRGETEPQWGISVAQVRQALREGPGSLRRGALAVIKLWMILEPSGIEQGWSDLAKPFLEHLWPKERRLVDEANSGALADLAVSAGPAFPEALSIVRDYIRPRGDGRLHLYAIKSSTAPTTHPRETLELLWLLCGPSGGTSYDMPELLDLLLAANEALSVDRRLQSLEQRSMRF